MIFVLIKQETRMLFRSDGEVAVRKDINDLVALGRGPGVNNRV